MDSMRMARILGWAGIIPLILANLGFWKGYGVVALTLGNMYAAIILGFLGAITATAVIRRFLGRRERLNDWCFRPVDWQFPHGLYPYQVRVPAG